jgi:polar amino acid transport system substrate-binding protein
MRFLGILVGLVLATGVAAEPVTVLGEEAPALYFKAADGSWDGLALDLVRLIAKRTGQSPTVTPVLWATGYQVALERPNVVLFSMVRTREREPLFHWVGPFVTLHFGLYARKGSHLTVSTLDDARKLLAGYLPVVASSSNRMAAELALTGAAPDAVEMIFPYLTAPLYFALSRSSDPALVRSWTKSFQDLRDDGTLASLIEKRFPGQTLPQADETAP